MEVTRTDVSDLDMARDILSRVQLPPEVTAIDLEVGPDHYGTSSLWLFFRIRPGLEADRATIKRLTDFSRQVQAQVIEGGVSLFPYTSLEDAA